MRRRKREPALTAGEEWSIHAARASAALTRGWNQQPVPSPLPLPPGEALFASSPVRVELHSAQEVAYSQAFVAGGSLGGLLMGAAASMAYNEHQRSGAERAAAPQWRAVGDGQLYLTNQRCALQLLPEWVDLHFATLRAVQRDALGLVVWRESAPAIRLLSDTVDYLNVMLMWLAFGQVVPFRPSAELARRAARAGWELPFADDPAPTWLPPTSAQPPDH